MLPRPIQEMADQLKDPDEIQDEAPAEQQQPEPEPEHDWKQRFSGYKASTDRTIHDLRQQLGSKDEQLARMQLQLEQLGSQVNAMAASRPQELVPLDVLSSDDIESLGEDNVNRMARIAQAAIEKQRKELDNRINAITAKQQRFDQERQQAEAQTEEQRFWGNVRKLVPDVDKIDNDPAFSEFLNQLDEYSGHSNREIGRHAKAIGDVKRTADLYLAFQKSQRGPTRDVSPVGVGSNTAPRAESGKKIWTVSEYETAVARLYRGGPLTKEREAKINQLHVSYAQALREGRVKRN